MLFGASQQNKELQQAAGQPKDTSPRVEKALNYSGKISSSKRSSESLTDSSEVRLSTGNSAPVKGSMEGYSYQKSAVIQPNNYGYANRQLQTARYQKSFQTHEAPYEGLPLVDLQQNKHRARIDNYTSYSAEGSSSDRLNKIVKNNMQF